MSELSLKTHYSTKELISFDLKSLPSAAKNVIEKAKRENWQSRKREGRGGGLEYELASMPEAIQAEIRTKLLKLLPAEVSKGELSVARQSMDLAKVTDKQLSTADGRLAVVRWYLMQEALSGLSRTKAMNMVVAAIASGQIPEEICKAVRVGNSKGCGELKLSKRTLYNWVLAFEAGENSAEQLRQMIPLKVQKRSIPERCPWLQAFLPFYQVHSNVSFTQAYAEFPESRP